MAKQWIQKATASIKKRGTAGKCTPITKPGCTGRAKALAKTFKAMAKKRKKAEDGTVISGQSKQPTASKTSALENRLAKYEKNKNKTSSSNVRANKVIGK